MRWWLPLGFVAQDCKNGNVLRGAKGIRRSGKPEIQQQTTKLSGKLNSQRQGKLREMAANQCLQR